MARIAVFTGRKHHTEKLIAIYRGLEEANHDVFWLTCNNSLNLDSPLEFLVPNGSRFLHAYDQVLADREKKQVDVYTKKILSKSKNVIQHFSPFWIINSAKEMAELFVLFEKVLKESNINAVVVLHNANFFSRILSFVAQKSKIPIFGFQEGMLRQRDQDSFHKNERIAEYTTKTFCWSRSDLEAIQEVDKNANLIVGGLYHLDDVYNLRLENKKVVKQRKILAFLPTISSEYVGNITADAQWINDACQQMNIDFVFKPHPFEEGSFGFQSYDGSIDDILIHADYIISQHSTVMVESAVLGIATAEINRTTHESTESLAGEAYAMIKNEQDFVQFVQEGFSSNKWAKSMGYKVGHQSRTIIAEIAKWL